MSFSASLHYLTYLTVEPNKRKLTNIYLTFILKSSKGLIISYLFLALKRNLSTRINFPKAFKFLKTSSLL